MMPERLWEMDGDQAKIHVLYVNIRRFFVEGVMVANCTL